MRRILKSHLPKTAVKLLVAESLIIAISVYLGISLRFTEPAGMSLAAWLVEYVPAVLMLVVISLFSMVTMGGYHIDNTEDLRYSFLRLMVALIFGLTLLSFAYYLFPQQYLGRGVLGISIGFSVLGIFLLRSFVHRRHRRDNVVERVLVLGSGMLAKECSDLIDAGGYQHKFKVVGFITMPSENREVDEARILPVEGSLADMAERYAVTEILVAVRNRRGAAFPTEELLDCKLSGIRVSDPATFFERETKQILIEHLQPSWLIFGGGFDQSFFRTSLKRDFDLLASFILLMATLPVMLLTALAILLEGLLARDLGPIFYRQERVGLDGESFMVLKFRSMRMDAEKFGVPQWATENDPRVTKVGRFIRKVRIDELPQIINVFRGEMSFVGPRPERPYFVKQFCEEIPYYNVRHSIKPGITGWAQVRYQYGASFDDTCMKLQYDLYYVKHHSLYLDIIILLDTIHVVLFGKGR